MKSFIYMLSALAVMGLAFWAYNENYKTQQTLADVEKLRRQIGQLMESRSVLRAEWAYLNRPDRLRELAELNYDRLGLMPLRPGQFGRIDQIGFPPDPMLMIENPTDVVGTRPETDTASTAPTATGPDEDAE